MSQEDVDPIRQLYRQFEQGDFLATEFFDPEVEHARIGGGDLAEGSRPLAWRASPRHRRFPSVPRL